MNFVIKKNEKFCDLNVKVLLTQKDGWPGPDEDVLAASCAFLPSTDAGPSHLDLKKK